MWDYCIELQALIRSHTNHSNYELGGEVPETHITLQTADTRNIYNYSWYEWVMFHDKPLTHQYLTVILGRYLGPAIDVGSIITYKIMKTNGKYVCRTTVCSLNPTELACSYYKQPRNEFDASVAEALGPAATIYDFDYNEYTDLTP